MQAYKIPSKFKAVIDEIKNSNYIYALELLANIQTNTQEKHLENKLYGSIYFKKKNWAKSLEYFNKVLKSDSKDLVVLNNVGVALFNIGRFNEAIKFFEKLSLFENNPLNTFRSLGITYKNIGNYEKAIECFLKVLKIQNNNNLIKQNLIDIFNYYIPKKSKNNNLLELNKEILNMNKEFNIKKLFDENSIKKFISKNFDKLSNFELDYKETQIFRRNKINLNCDRHFLVFNRHKIIPKYCFNCYKIQIDVKNILELIKLFLIFNNIELKNNNIRKCLVETRNKISGNYKGYVFCTGLDEAKKLLIIFSNEIEKSEITAKEIKIKHGCTEFYEEYPQYEDINYNGKQIFKYQNGWEEKEYNFDKEFHRNQLKDEKVVGPTINQINLSDILIIKNWIAYANLIEDNSVFKIFGEEIRSNYINETIKDQINYRRNN